MENQFNNPDILSYLNSMHILYTFAPPYYYVGSAPFHKVGIMLFNPKSKQTIIRRSFHQLNPTDAIIPTLPLSVPNTDDSHDSSVDPTTYVALVLSYILPSPLYLQGLILQSL